MLVVLFGMAFSIRMYDLTDLPIDFHPTRQLLSAIKARGLYFETQPDGHSTWQLETGIHQAQLKADVEPVVFERLVAFTYQFTGERVWIARIYSSVFWLIGGMFLLMLLRDLVSFEGAFVSTAYYLLFPYAIIASRSFQPDPLMVGLIITFWWILLRWSRFPTWTNTILSGLLGGFAIFIKFSAVFFVLGGALGLVLSDYPFRDLVRNRKIWGMVVLGVLPPLGYLIYGVFIAGYLGGQFRGRFIPALLLSPLNYLQWEVKASLAAGGVFIMLGLLGFFLTRNGKFRSFMFGLWGGYLLYGLFFDYHVATHDYYHLPLIAIVAIAICPLGGMVFARLAETAVRDWMRVAVLAILVYGMFSVVWDVRDQMKAVDYRPEAAMWAEIGKKLNYESDAIALTDDYGSRLQYFGWTTATAWPTSGDIYASSLRGKNFNFAREFPKRVRSNSFFLVTDFQELKLQPELEALLETHPVFAKGDGYIIYDLRESK